ncbi:sigma 54-interacting transcriptional regulator [Nitrospira sp. Ecomares 2.1]
MSRLKPIKISFLIGLVAISVAGIVWITLSDFLDPWEWSTLDARLRMVENRSESSSIVLIGRDAKSEAEFGVGLWDRAAFATVIEALGEAGASVIALDFHFAGKSPPERGGTQSDAKLIQAVRSTKNVIVPLAVTVSGDSSLSTASTIPQELRDALQHGSSAPSYLRDEDSLIQTRLLSPPLTGLASSASGIGHIAASSDSDGVYRRVPSHVRLDNQIVPAFGVAVAAAYLNISRQPIPLKSGNRLQIHKNEKTSSALVNFPVDNQGRFFIRYAGRWLESPFPYFSFLDIWEAIQADRKDEIKHYMAGKIVLMMHAALSADKRRTPFETSVPGGFVHANVIQTLLNGNGLKESSKLGIGLLMTGSAVLVAFLALTLPLGTALCGIIAFTFLYLGISHVGLSSSDLVLPILPILATIAASMTISFIYIRWKNELQIQDFEKERIRLHRDILEAKELLTSQESKSERLEDDLAALRDQFEAQEEEKEVFASQIEKEKQSLAEANEQERLTRKHLGELEKELASHQLIHVHQPSLPTETLKTLQEECQELGIFTQDPTLLKCYQDLKRVAGRKTPIRILGEPGTGKELFARAAHRLSPRAQGPFVAVNMSAIPTELFESELFGHKKGSFTGAAQDRPGLYESSDNGTLFLDEIGDLPLHQQAKLLRVLQEGIFTRVGEAKPRKADVCIISATNKDVLKGIAEGWFREDLYYRLKGLEISLPPLRDRPGDLPLLAAELIGRITAEQGFRNVRLSVEAMNTIQRWPWKGNIRELQHCLETAVSLAEKGVIRPDDLRLIPQVKPEGDNQPFSPSTIPPGDPKKDDAVLLAYLRQHSFDLQATGQTLGWDRSTIMQRLKGMCFQTLVDKNGDLRATATSLAGEPGLIRLVEVKLKEYVQHLKKVTATFSTEDAARAGCRKRFKNLPDRYHDALGTLVEAFFKSETFLK